MKGQYFLPMVLLALFLVSTLFLYYSNLHTTVSYSSYPKNPRLAPYLENAKSCLIHRYIQGIYSGDTSLDTTVNELKSKAKTLGMQLNVTCTQGSQNSTFWLNCSLECKDEDQKIETKFNYTYTVPFSIKTFSDPDYINETAYFYKGDQVYIWVSGNNSDWINVTILDPYDGVYTNFTGKLENWHWTGDFKPGISGNWTIVANDMNTTERVSKKIHVNIVDLDVKTFDSQGNPQTDFYPGETVNISVALKDLWERGLNCTVKLSFINALGKMAYNIQGETVNGQMNASVRLSPWEIPGNMSVIATEHCYWSQDRVNITILGINWTKYIEITPPRMKYNRNYSDVFGLGCGYAEWYTENQTNYSEVPFYVEIESQNKTLAIHNSTEVIDVPNVYAIKVHYLGSKR